MQVRCRITQAVHTTHVGSASRTCTRHRQQACDGERTTVGSDGGCACGWLVDLYCGRGRSVSERTRDIRTEANPIDLDATITTGAQ